jgi:hypothetical protein
VERKKYMADREDKKGNRRGRSWGEKGKRVEVEELKGKQV